MQVARLESLRAYKLQTLQHQWRAGCRLDSCQLLNHKPVKPSELHALHLTCLDEKQSRMRCVQAPR